MRRTCDSPLSCASGRAGHLQDLLGATGRENEPSSFLDLSSPLVSVKSWIGKWGPLSRSRGKELIGGGPGSLKCYPPSP